MDITASRIVDLAAYRRSKRAVPVGVWWLAALGLSLIMWAGIVRLALLAF
jgi:hypothetical protein